MVVVDHQHHIMVVVDHQRHIMVVDYQRHIMVVVDHQRHIMVVVDHQRHIMVVVDHQHHIMVVVDHQHHIMVVDVVVLLIVQHQHQHHTTAQYVDRVVYQEGAVLVHFAVAALCHHQACLLQITRALDYQHHLMAVTGDHIGAVLVQFAVCYPDLLVHRIAARTIPQTQETTPRLLAAHVAEDLGVVVGLFHDR